MTVLIRFTNEIHIKRDIWRKLCFKYPHRISQQHPTFEANQILVFVCAGIEAIANLVQSKK